MDKKELMIELGKLHKTMCIEAGCKTLGECSNFLTDTILENDNLTLEKSFKKFEEKSKYNWNKVKRLVRISEENLKYLNELKSESEKLNLMNYKFHKDLNYKQGYYDIY